MDILECSQPWKKILCLRRCYGKINFYALCCQLAVFFSSFVRIDLISFWDVEQSGGCGYVEWHDPPLSKFLSDLVGDLRDEVWRLRSGGNQTEDQTGRRDEIMQDLQDQLKGKDAEISAIRVRYERRQMIMMYMNVLFGIIIFVSGVVLGLMLMR